MALKSFVVVPHNVATLRTRVTFPLQISRIVRVSPASVVASKSPNRAAAEAQYLRAALIGIMLDGAKYVRTHD